MAKPKTEKVKARNVHRGAIVVPKDIDLPDGEVVRAVDVVIHLANGMDIVVPSMDEVEVVVDEPPIVSEDDATA